MKKDNQTLYLFQGIACILVVLIHIPFPGTLGIFFISLARVAVPLFFMISGYTLWGIIETPSYKTKLKSRIKRNLSVFAAALSVYFIIDILKCIIQGESITAFLLGIVELPNLLLLVFVGIIPPGSGGVLWFILALVYIYAIRLVLPFKNKNIYRSAAVSFVIMLLFSLLKIYFTANKTFLFGLDLSTYWIYGNWAIIGFMSMNIGVALAKAVDEHRDAVLKLRKFCPAVILICAAVNFIVCYVLDRDFGMYLSYTLFTLIIDAAFFVISVKDTVGSENVLARIGKYHSRNVYLFHHIFISVTNYAIIFAGLSKNSAMPYIQPVAVIVSALVFSIILNTLMSKIGGRSKTKNTESTKTEALVK